ncbi:MAG: hypothetical protein FWC00_00255 [Firmicutes bacterium]|nr:hypothetical protein [Bacillota bacterium]
MLDKQTSKFLKVIAKICEDGSYKIIEKSFLSAYTASVDQMIRFLQDNEMIDVKYSDEGVYCLSVLPKGRVTIETARTGGRNPKIGNRNLLILIGVAFLASFIGAFLGTLLAGVF